MPAISGTTQNLINGVSRQPMAVRLPTQLDEQVNGFSTPARGHQKRPPTFHVKSVGDNFPSNTFTHDINRDAEERYHVLITDGDLKVFDKTGQEKIVAFPNGKAYLTAADPVSMFAATTSADHTFIANKTVVCAMNPSLVDSSAVQEALVYVRAVNYSKDYRIYINGALAAHYRTTDGADSNADIQRAKQRTVQPINIAKVLFWGNLVATAADQEMANGTTVGTVYTSGSINGWTGADGCASATFSTGTETGVFRRLIDHLPSADWTVARYANVLHIKRTDGTPFTIRSEGDSGTTNENIITIKKVVQDFTDLPSHGPEGFVVEIAGKPTDGTDNYWVKLSKPEGSNDNDTVVWRECPAPGALIAFDPSTLPHVLRRETSGSFTFAQAVWANRRTGNEEFSPSPSFVGGKILDVFFHRGRLGFLRDESAILTRAGEFFDFWRTTLTTNVDDDPIDVAGTDDVVSIFNQAITFDEELFLVSDQAIHRLEGGELLTQSSVKLALTAQEPIDISVPPVATSRSIFYLAGNSVTGDQQDYSDVRELYFATDTERDLTGSVSDHVPGYIAKDIRKLLSSPTNNLLLVLPKGITGSIFVYQYYWAGDEKLQSAWHRWELGAGVGILGGAVWGDEVHLVLQRGPTTTFERLPVKAFLGDPGRKWMIRLDRRLSNQGVSTPTYDPVTDTTAFLLPYVADPDTRAVFGPTHPQHGFVCDLVGFNSTTLTLHGNHMTTDLVFGKLYEHRFRLNQFFVRSREDRGSVPVLSTRLQMLRIFPQFVDTAHFKVEVTPRHRAAVRSKTYAPYTGVDAFSHSDQTISRSGTVGIPVNADAELCTIEVVNATHLPASFTGLEWEGISVPRSRRIA